MLAPRRSPFPPPNFQQVVDALVFEGFQGIGVVGRDEDDRHGDLRALEDVEPAAVSEVDVHENQVVTDAGDDSGGLRDRRCRGDDLDLRRDLCERRAQLRDRQRLVLYDNGSHDV